MRPKIKQKQTNINQTSNLAISCPLLELLVITVLSVSQVEWNRARHTGQGCPRDAMCVCMCA